MTIRVLLADDHAIFCEGLRALLARESDLKVIETAQDGFEAVRLSRAAQPQLVIIDLSMAGMNGMEATRQIKAVQPMIKLLCLSMHAEEHFVAAAINAGVDGYVLKDCAGEELVRAIHTVMTGQTYLSPVIAGVVVERCKAGAGEPLSDTVFARLSNREREVLQLIAEGNGCKVIAERLHLSTKTIGTYREHLMKKLQLHSVAGLTKYAIRQGLTLLDR